MNKYYLFIALAMVAAITVSCKSNKTEKEASEATEEVVEAAKTILADDVLATLDEIAKPFINDAGKVEAYRIIADNLTPEEKLVKPDYLMDPSEVDTMMTKSQKVNALAVLEPADDILVDVCGFVKIEPVGLCEGDKFLNLPVRFLHCSGDAHII